MPVHKTFDSDGEGETNLQPSANPKLPKPTKTISKKSNFRSSLNRNTKSRNKSIKSQIRSIERLLKNRAHQLNSSVRKSKQLELAELFRLRDERDRRTKEKDMAQKYRMLKFFERRKIQRTLDKIEGHGDKPEDAEKKSQCLRDMRYVVQFPKNRKYISLYPTGGHTQESQKRVDAIRAEIENPALSNTNIISVPDKDRHKEHEQEDDFFLHDPNE